MSKASETQVVSNGETEATGRQNGLFERSGWCRWDAVALSVWTAALAVFFWDALSCAGPSFTLTLPRSTTLIARFSRKNCGRAILALVPGALLRLAAL